MRTYLVDEICKAFNDGRSFAVFLPFFSALNSFLFFLCQWHVHSVPVSAGLCYHSLLSMSFATGPTFLTKTALFLILLCLSYSNARGVVNKRSVGALTPLSSKSKICNVLDYGGVADGTTDVGPAISKAFSTCVVGNAATLYVPGGNYSCTQSYGPGLPGEN